MTLTEKLQQANAGSPELDAGGYPKSMGEILDRQSKVNVLRPALRAREAQSCATNLYQ